MQCHTAQCIIHINLKTIFSSDTFNACISNTYCLWHCFPPDSVKSFTLFHLLPLSLSQCLCHFFHPWQTVRKEHLITLAEIILIFPCQFIEITVPLAATMTDMKVFTGLTVLIGGICFSSFYSYINLKML